ncbi:MAG TPA: hypothetical protein VFI96_03520 [Longimicrobiaceae bacterium]|nr:hypothetical protein [Longimicrobiaceae bacterium]
MRSLSRSLSVLLLVLLAACAGNQIASSEEGVGAASPAAAVERFIHLSEQKAYDQMGWVFGTKDGPVAASWDRGEVERRMYAIGTILQHDSYVVGQGVPVPGRIGQAVGFDVKLLRGATAISVPFTTVLGPDDRWFVEQVAVEAVTNPQ